MRPLLMTQAEFEKRKLNFESHKNIELIGEGELAWCADCKGGESDLFEHTCKENKELTQEEMLMYEVSCEQSNKPK